MAQQPQPNNTNVARNEPMPVEDSDVEIDDTMHQETQPVAKVSNKQGTKRSHDEVAPTQHDFTKLFNATVTKGLVKADTDTIAKAVRWISEQGLNDIHAVERMVRHMDPSPINKPLIYSAIEYLARKPETKPSKKAKTNNNQPRTRRVVHTVRSIANRIKNSAKYKEAFPDEDSFDVVDVEIIECRVCKRHVFLKRPGNLGRLHEHCFGKYSRDRNTAFPMHLRSVEALKHNIDGIAPKPGNRTERKEKSKQQKRVLCYCLMEASKSQDENPIYTCGMKTRPCLFQRRFKNNNVPAYEYDSDGDEVDGALLKKLRTPQE